MTMNPARVVRAPMFRQCALLLLSAAVLVAPADAVRAVVSCGATVFVDVTLDQDLVCAGPGLVAGADGIEIDLNGHSITGPGTGNGILVSGRENVSILGGTMANFGAAVFVVNSTEVTIKDLVLSNNTDGIDLQSGSTFVTIKENTFLSNRARGVMLRGGTADNTVKDNRFAGNRVGILVNGAIATTVKENVVESSIQFGIRVGVVATGNLLIHNIVSSNPVGIGFLADGTAVPVGNQFRENSVSSNTCGLQGPYSGNTFKANVFTGNAADICP